MYNELCATHKKSSSSVNTLFFPAVSPPVGLVTDGLRLTLSTCNWFDACLVVLVRFEPTSNSADNLESFRVRTDPKSTLSCLEWFLGLRSESGGFDLVSVKLVPRSKLSQSIAV